jgi:hypothetical protein
MVILAGCWNLGHHYDTAHDPHPQVFGTPRDTLYPRRSPLKED